MITHKRYYALWLALGFVWVMPLTMWFLGGILMFPLDCSEVRIEWRACQLSNHFLLYFPYLAFALCHLLPRNFPRLSIPLTLGIYAGAVHAAILSYKLENIGEKTVGATIVLTLLFGIVFGIAASVMLLLAYLLERFIRRFDDAA